MSDAVLDVLDVSKSFAGVHALDKVSLTVNRGEIHSLMGENGSGKSTLIKIVAGVVQPDQGQISINGTVLRKFTAIDTIRAGLGVIYQDLALYPNLSVAENILLNRMVEKKKKFVDWKKIREAAEEEFRKIGKAPDLNEQVENLSMANRQIVAITRALAQGAKIIIMDEPTTALTKSEIDNLFSVILNLKKQGISTLFVSHKLSEVFEISDKITIIRDGRLIGTFGAKELDPEKLIFLMTGKQIEQSCFEFNKQEQEQKPLLEVRGLTKKNNFTNISFKLWPGEILGITGRLGSGRTELALSLFGLNKEDSGEVLINGKKVQIRTAQNAVRLGIGYLPEDRVTEGLFTAHSISNNIVVSILNRLTNRLGLLGRSAQNLNARKWSQELKIKTPSLDAEVQSLSGGNQQRVVIAKWLATKPRIFILDNPTVGIDVASKAAIHEIVRSLAAQGIGIIIISDEISEILQNCNRVIVMRNGTISYQVEAGAICANDLFDVVNG